jgi:predicted HTH transcriptional regulator
MNEGQLKALIDNLTRQPRECEWLEFKQNFHSLEEIGESISGLANSACLHHQAYGYLVFGVVDESHEIVGTTFKVKHYKKGNEELENWLITRLRPRPDFRCYELQYDEARKLSVIIVPAATNEPVSFLHKRYIRINSTTRLLSDFSGKESAIWKQNTQPFESEIVLTGLAGSDVISLLSTETYFDLVKVPYPSDQRGVLSKFEEEGFVVNEPAGYAITNLGAILFAKSLADFDGLSRKATRVIVYKGQSKVDTEREQTGKRGYAIGFTGLIDWINGQLPANEEIGKALRQETVMYPPRAIRELVGNALIHQDFHEKGFPMIEIFNGRIEISNAGTPLINPDRFIDAYQSRNDKLADVMRRMGFCEEKGSGLDKVIFYNELFQLPPIDISVSERRTKVTMYAYKSLGDLDRKEKVRACYQHACLKYVSNEKMTNQTLRERFKIDEQNAAIASRIIKDTLQANLIKPEDPENRSTRLNRYVPMWA